jgi:hypothetical protein
MKSKRLMSMVAIGTLCAVVGTAAGIAGGSAATSGKSSGSQKPGKSARAGHASRRGAPFHVMHGGPPVHEEAVVLNRSGDGFVTVTTDAGTVDSVSGDKLAITEGFESVTYKQVTLTVADDAIVYRNGRKASLGDLREGDHVIVHASSESTHVDAFSSDFRPPRFRGRRPGAPPPGAPRGEWHDGQQMGPPMGPPPAG